ncbi:MAG: SLC13/DASS family transporter [Bacteroidales bacterium]|nr:SLC13/DASS family transporter [Bacteroidales bacterium]
MSDKKTCNCKFSVKYCVLLPIVLLVTIFLLAVPTTFFGIEGLTVLQQRTIALFVFAALMWIFEIIPSWTTSVLIIVISLLILSNKGLGFLMHDASGALLPGTMNYTKLMSAFADPVVMLFLGGFALAIMAQKYGLDVTLARFLLRPFGTNPRMVLLGFLSVIAIFSMFMSNTATAAMMLAFLAPVLATFPDGDKGKIALALSIPIAANIGGIGTTIGTPPNGTAVSNLETYFGISISFGEWAIHMVPFVVIMILVAWLVLMWMFPFSSKKLEINIPKNTKPTTWRTYLVWATFAITIILWATESLTKISSNIVALIPLGVFVATGTFDKEDIKQIDWSVLWLVAGGFALGYAMLDVSKGGTGLGAALVNAIPFGSMSIILVFAVAGLVCYALSNFISNSATAALLIPILCAVSSGLLSNPAFEQWGGTKAMVCFVATCASLAMLMPISTPPNAIAYSTGLIKTKDMLKVGAVVGVFGLIFGFFWLTKIFPFA